jgi:hypothetical protein
MWTLLGLATPHHSCSPLSEQVRRLQYVAFLPPQSEYIPPSKTVNQATGWKLGLVGDCSISIKKGKITVGNGLVEPGKPYVSRIWRTDWRYYDGAFKGDVGWGCREICRCCYSLMPEYQCLGWFGL